MNYMPIAFLVLATYTDAKDHKIRNNLTYSLILIGLIVSTYRFGFNGFLASMGGIIISLTVASLLPGFRHGGGDIKLSMGIGSFLGVTLILYFLFFWFALTLLICNIKLIKNLGFKNYKNTVIKEILSVGQSEEDNESTIGAPTMLVAYLIVLIFL